jgi:succinate dehydrogenase / fumarate reductase flavoprotein subunit
LGGNSLSDLLVFGKLAGEHAAKFAKENTGGSLDEQQITEASTKALEPFERVEGDSPFHIQYDLQEMMQELVGIVRHEHELLRATEHLKMMQKRAAKVKVVGNREYNPGWHTAIDLRHLLTVSEAITMAALERKESRGAHFREDYPHKDEESGKFNLVIKKNVNGQMELRKEPLKEVRADLKQIILEMK